MNLRITSPSAPSAQSSAAAAGLVPSAVRYTDDGRRTGPLRPAACRAADRRQGVTGRWVEASERACPISYATALRPGGGRATVTRLRPFVLDSYIAAAARSH